MNYFEFYELPLSFFPDEDLLKEKFYGNSKKFHPDFFINEPEEKQEEILQLSTLNNNAYKTLSSPAKRLDYILTIKGMINDTEKFTLPQDFLMEMMDINESLMDLEFDRDAAKEDALRKEVKTISDHIDDQLQKLLSGYTENGDQSVLLRATDLYYRKKYLLRIMESLEKLTR